MFLVSLNVAYSSESKTVLLASRNDSQGTLQKCQIINRLQQFYRVKHLTEMKTITKTKEHMYFKGFDICKFDFKL